MSKKEKGILKIKSEDLPLKYLCVSADSYSNFVEKKRLPSLTSLTIAVVDLAGEPLEFEWKIFPREKQLSIWLTVTECEIILPKHFRFNFSIREKIRQRDQHRRDNEGGGSAPVPV